MDHRWMARALGLVADVLSAACAHVLIAVAAAAPPTVGSLGELETALPGLGAGATVQLADGLYATTEAIRIEGKRGTAEAPIVIRAEHRGRVTIGGGAGLVVKDSEHLVLEGLVFAHDADRPAILLDNCRHIRVTRNHFCPRERSKPRHMEHWVYVIGARSGHNRIDHNLFARKVNSGSPVFVRGDDAALVCSQADRIDHNHFRDVIYADGQNGHETIRTGSNDLGATDRSSSTTIDHNLLERCSGETEIISLKSSGNIVSRNTLWNCRGAICLRLGNRNVVSGNFVLAEDGQTGCGGVKLYGFDHRVFNNYFMGLTGKGHDAPLALVPGTMEAPATENIGKRYVDLTCAPPTRAWIAFNTWVNCAPLQFGFEKRDDVRRHVPNECTFENNIVAHPGPRSFPLVNLGLLRGLRAHGNLGHPGDVPADAAWATYFRFVDVGLRRAESGAGLWRLTQASPAIDAATEAGSAIEDDVFGRRRIGRRDVGAEEFGPGNPPGGPLTAADVGPDAP